MQDFYVQTFKKKTKIQKKAKQKERKNMTEVKGSHLREKAAVRLI